MLQQNISSKLQQLDFHVTCVWKDTYSILEAEQHPLQATGRYCSTLQFGPELQQAAGQLLPVRAEDVFPQAANQLTDVVAT